VSVVTLHPGGGWNEENHVWRTREKTKKKEREQDNQTWKTDYVEQRKVRIQQTTKTKKLLQRNTKGTEVIRRVENRGGSRNSRRREGTNSTGLSKHA